MIYLTFHNCNITNVPQCRIKLQMPVTTVYEDTVLRLLMNNVAPTSNF